MWEKVFTVHRRKEERTKPPITGADFLTIIYPRPRYHFDDFPKKNRKGRTCRPWISLIFPPFTTDFSLFFFCFLFISFQKKSTVRFWLGFGLYGGVDGPTQPTMYKDSSSFFSISFLKTGSSVSLTNTIPSQASKKHVSSHHRLRI